MSDPDVNELDALTALVESDGWHLFLQHVEANHGDTANVRQIDTALGAVGRGDHDAVQDTVQQIRAAARAVRSMVAWPKERAKAIRDAKQKPARFASLRRA